MLDFAIDLGRRAGALLRDGLDRRRTIELKGAFDLVTDMDRASEDLIVSACNQALKKVRAAVHEETQKMASGLGLPAGMGMPGLE